MEGEFDSGGHESVVGADNGERTGVLWSVEVAEGLVVAGGFLGKADEAGKIKVGRERAGRGVVHETKIPAELDLLKDDLLVKVAIHSFPPAVKLEARVREGDPEVVLVRVTRLIQLEHELDHDTNVVFAGAKR